MKCPKCNYDIDDKMLFCPNCKKVLKLVCPKCNTINKTNTCKKCGFVIITKCHKCGKINPTISETCSKCGFSTYTSVAINSSNIDEFACLTIEFPNLEDIKPALGSTKLTEKFKANLDNLILNYSKSVGVSREIIENVYIIRFNKDATFLASANNAIKSAIEIQNAITELNFKLRKLSSITLQCNIAVLKRDIYSQPNQYKSGFDIRLIYQHKKDFNLLNNLQVITDSHVYEQICDNFDLSVLTSKFIKNEMMTFFELNLKKYIKIPKEKKEEEVVDLSKLNLFDETPEDTEKESKLYDIDSINFDELKCMFKPVKSVNLIPEIIGTFKKSPKKIISVKCEKEFTPATDEVIKNISKANLFKKVYHVTCHDEMKYKPYGFFYELISSMYNFVQSPRNFDKNDFEIFKFIDVSGFLKDFINLNVRDFPHPEDARYSLFDIFFNIFNGISKSLIYIENFEKMDNTSYEVLQLFFEKFNDLGVSYLAVTSKEAPVHKKSHFLLANPDYIEITPKPTSVKEIISKNPKKYENILDSYYLKKIAQNTKGSVLYFNHAIDYLVEKDILGLKSGILSVESSENILIPATLNELIAKRLKFLSTEKDIFKIFGMFLLIGPAIDMQTLKLLGDIKLIQKLIEKRYIYTENKIIYINNYNLYKDNFLADTSLTTKQAIAKELLQKAFASEIKHPCEINLYNMLEQSRQEFLTLERLSQLNASLGDFSAYLNCSVKFLKLLDNNVNENSQKTIEEYKMEVYENISNLLYKYSPSEIYNIARIILSNLEKTTNDKKVIDLCNKMLQGCLISGNYSYAFGLLHKIFLRFPNASINPNSKNFDKAFFLISLVKIEILFSIGNLKDCEEAGEEILSILSPEVLPKLKPESLSEKQFEDVIFDAFSFVAIAKVILLRSNNEIIKFIEKIAANMGQVPDTFELFLILAMLIKGEEINIPKEIPETGDKFSKIIFNIIRAFSENKNNWEKFADNIYQAKLSAKMHKLSQIELFCDLLIGYAYFNLEKIQKASLIYYNVLEASSRNGLKIITYLAWYLISVLKYQQQEIEIAFGLTKNVVVQLEKDRNSGDFLFFLLRILLAKIFIARNEQEHADLCLENAKFIEEKYSLKFNTGEMP
ncbi:MAG: hypothetical protein PHC64_02115 [Candidatus Gastranaerophilales bacterium]|nr:hypothetical protein [Candidatus Gastranaerophilales bacterium]